MGESEKNLPLTLIDRLSPISATKASSWWETAILFAMKKEPGVPPSLSAEVISAHDPVLAASPPLDPYRN